MPEARLVPREAVGPRSLGASPWVLGLFTALLVADRAWSQAPPDCGAQLSQPVSIQFTANSSPPTVINATITVYERCVRFVPDGKGPIDLPCVDLGEAGGKRVLAYCAKFEGAGLASVPGTGSFKGLVKFFRTAVNPSAPVPTNPNQTTPIPGGTRFVQLVEGVLTWQASPLLKPTRFVLPPPPHPADNGHKQGHGGPPGAGAPLPPGGPAPPQPSPTGPPAGAPTPPPGPSPPGNPAPPPGAPANPAPPGPPLPGSGEDVEPVPGLDRGSSPPDITPEYFDETVMDTPGAGQSSGGFLYFPGGPFGFETAEFLFYTWRFDQDGSPTGVVVWGYGLRHERSDPGSTQVSAEPEPFLVLPGDPLYDELERERRAAVGF